MGNMYVMWKIYLFKGICSNVKCMYASAFGHIVDCREFI